MAVRDRGTRIKIWLFCQLLDSSGICVQPGAELLLFPSHNVEWQWTGWWNTTISLVLLHLLGQSPLQRVRPESAPAAFRGQFYWPSWHCWSWWPKGYLSPACPAAAWLEQLRCKHLLAVSLLSWAAWEAGYPSPSALAHPSLQYCVSPSKAAFQRLGQILMPSSFDQSPRLVVKGRVNSWTCTCWGEAFSSFLQSQTISVQLGGDDFAPWGCFRRVILFFRILNEVSSQSALLLCWAISLWSCKTLRYLLWEQT